MFDLCALMALNSLISLAEDPEVHQASPHFAVIFSYDLCAITPCVGVCTDVGFNTCPSIMTRWVTYSCEINRYKLYCSSNKNNTCIQYVCTLVILVHIIMKSVMLECTTT